MQNIKLIIAYDGTNYLGWQKTEMGASIEGALEKVLKQVLQEEVVLQAASRTDAGVHAEGQVVNFLSCKKELDLEKLHKSLRGLLPKDIAVLEVSKAEGSFHPTLDNEGKQYQYHLCLSSTQSPFYRHFSWHFPSALNLEEMRAAAKLFLGTRDFSTFCNEQNLMLRDGICRIDKIDIEELPGQRLRISISGSRFLYKMVRNLVGTLAYIGCGKLKCEEIPAILASKKRASAGVTAPAHGLTLKEVFF